MIKRTCKNAPQLHQLHVGEVDVSAPQDFSFQQVLSQLPKTSWGKHPIRFRIGSYFLSEPVTKVFISIQESCA